MNAHDLKYIAQVDGAVFLIFQRCQLTRGALAPLDGVKQLQLLAFWDTAIDDSELSALKSLPNLSSFHASGHITSRGLPFLAAALTLRSLRLDFTDVGDDVLATVAQLDGVTELGLKATRVTDEGLAVLSASPHRLDLNLNLSSCNITDAGVAHLVGLNHQLTALWLDETSIGDSGLMDVGQLSRLKYLSLRKTSITDAGMLHLTPLTELRSLDISDTGISDRGLVSLKSLPKLADVLAWHTNVTNRAAEILTAGYIGFGDDEEIRR